METCNFGGRFGPDMAHFAPSGPCHSLSFGVSPLTATRDSSEALLRLLLEAPLRLLLGSSEALLRLLLGSS